MLPRSPSITKCHRCLATLWVEDMPELGQDLDARPEWSDAPYIEELAEAELLAAIRSGTAAEPDREKELRVLAFRRSNDRDRDSCTPPVGDEARHSEAQAANMRALSALLDIDVEDERLLKAEIERELGAFQRGLELLREPVEPEGSFAWFVRRELIRLCESRDPCLQRLDYRTYDRKRRLTEELTAVSMDLKRFLMECCVREPQARVSEFEFTAAFESWCKEGGHAPRTPLNSVIGRPDRIVGPDTETNYRGVLTERLRESGFDAHGRWIEDIRVTYTTVQLEEWARSWKVWRGKQPEAGE